MQIALLPKVCMPFSLSCHKKITTRMDNNLMLLLPILIGIVSHGIPLGKSESSTALALALYVFGDSQLDSGNNNLLPTLAKADFSPYGMNFAKGATGRFTNGRTVADFIAEFLGFPYSPPYLSIVGRVLREEQYRGLNFASGSCGILPETGHKLGKCLNFPEQVDLFEKMVEEELRPRYQGTDELSNYLSKSLFVIAIGSNDYVNNYMDSNSNSRESYTPEAFAKLLIDRLAEQFQRLYRLGARKVVMFEIGPIGCIPNRARQFKHTGQCAEDINQLAVMFNNHLATMLQNLTSTLQGSAFTLGHAHQLAYDAIINHAKYGLSDSSNPCCVTWLNGTSACIPGLRALACKDPNQHYFWDGYHLTESVYRTIALNCFNGSSVCIPKNIKQLLSQV